MYCFTVAVDPEGRPDLARSSAQDLSQCCNQGVSQASTEQVCTSNPFKWLWGEVSLLKDNIFPVHFQIDEFLSQNFCLPELKMLWQMLYLLDGVVQLALITLSVSRVTMNLVAT